MGRGDNRRTPKVRQRKSWRKLKERTKKHIAEAKASSKAGGARKPAAARTTITRHPAGQAPNT